MNGQALQRSLAKDLALNDDKFVSLHFLSPPQLIVYYCFEILLGILQNIAVY